MTHTITVKTDLLPGDKCLVANYKCRPAQWEEGEVRSVNVSISAEGSHYVLYRVILDRRSAGKYKDYTGVIRLTVGADTIQLIERTGTINVKRKRGKFTTSTTNH